MPLLPGPSRIQAAASLDAGIFTYIYSTDTTLSDPGSGGIKFDSASLSVANTSSIRISETDSSAKNAAAYIQACKGNTVGSKGGRGLIMMWKTSDPTTLTIIQFLTAITDNGGWDDATINLQSKNGAFANGDAVTLAFVPQQGVHRAPGWYAPYNDDTTFATTGSGEWSQNVASDSAATQIAVGIGIPPGNPITYWLAFANSSASGGAQQLGFTGQRGYLELWPMNYDLGVPWLQYQVQGISYDGSANYVVLAVTEIDIQGGPYAVDGDIFYLNWKPTYTATETVRTAAGVPSGAPVLGESVVAYDSTAVTGGTYLWRSGAWTKIANII